MIKFIILFVVLVLASAGAAEAKFEKMTDHKYYNLPAEEVGRFSYTGSVREWVEAVPFIEDSEQSDLIRDMEVASATVKKYGEVTSGLGLPVHAKELLQELARYRGFLFKEHMEEWGVPAEVIELFELKKTYELGEVRDGEICLGMSFTVNGVHKMRNIVYRGPATPAVVFKTNKGRTVKIVLKCNNGCVSPPQAVDLTIAHVPEDRPTVGEELAKDLPPRSPRSQPHVSGQPGSTVARWPLDLVGECPDVSTLKVNIWERKAFYLPGVTSTHDKEKRQTRFIGLPHVSQMHGGEFRRARDAGLIRHSVVAHKFRVSLIMTPEVFGGPPMITSEKVLTEVTVTGLLELRLTRSELEEWHAIRVVWLGDKTPASPPRYSPTQEYEIRFFNRLQGAKFGEWDNNPVPDCITNEHWIEW